MLLVRISNIVFDIYCDAISWFQRNIEPLLAWCKALSLLLWKQKIFADCNISTWWCVKCEKDAFFSFFYSSLSFSSTCSPFSSFSSASALSLFYPGSLLPPSAGCRFSIVSRTNQFNQQTEIIISIAHQTSHATHSHTFKRTFCIIVRVSPYTESKYLPIYPKLTCHFTHFTV